MARNTNEGENNLYDFCVVGDNTNPTFGVKAVQGSQSLATGNLFCHTTDNPPSDFWNTGVPIKYYHFGLQDHLNSEYPEYASPTVDPDNPTNIQQNGCDNNFDFSTDDDPGSGGCTHCLTYAGYTGVYSDFVTAYDSRKLAYIALINGGNTQACMSQADTTSNATALKDTMLAYAPNLSAEVLEIIAQRSSLLNDTQQYDILKANAEGVNGKVMAEWVKWAAPPQWMRDSVIAAQANLTYRTYLLDTVIYNAEQKQQTVYSILRLLQQDTAGLNITAYRNWLDSADGIWAKREMVNTYFLENRLDTIEALIGNYDTLIHKADSINFKSYKDYVLAHKAWLEADSFIPRFNSESVGDIIGLAEANEHEKGSNMARNLLNFFFDSLYFTPGELPDVVYAKKENEAPAFSKSPAALKVSPPSIKVYPNPAQNLITIEYGSVPENSRLFIVSMIGEIMENKMLNGNGKVDVNTSSYQNGVYLARIETGAKALLKSKFIILK